MADVVVVGAGLAGLAVAARLAKLGHQVTVCERNAYAGGAMHRVESAGFSWDAGPQSTTLPAVLRDLFHTSGRPLERYLDLQMRTPARRHVFEDGSVVDLPTGSATEQGSAVDAGLGAGSGDLWSAYVDGLAGTWDVLRRAVLDVPDGGSRLADADTARRLDVQLSVDKQVRRRFKDERLRAMAVHPFVLAGSAPRDVPAYAGIVHYLERTFGSWSTADGLTAVTDALVTRLAERGVDLRLGCPVERILLDDRGVTGVRTTAGVDIRADEVVADVDPRTVLVHLVDDPRVEEARRAFTAANQAVPPTVTHLGLVGDTPPLPDETVLHGEPLVVVCTGGTAPDGQRAWTLWHRGSTHEDILLTLARRGIDVRTQVVARIDRTPAEVVGETGGSPFGVAWSGGKSAARRAALTHPMPGLYLVGASVHPGASVPYVAWGAAHVAQRIGKA